MPALRWDRICSHLFSSFLKKAALPQPTNACRRRQSDVLKKISGTGLNILAVHDMSVPEPATPAGAIDVFRRSDCDIDATIGSSPNLIRVAVLVRTAEQFNGQLEFNAKARLRNWCLLRIPKNDDGTYTSDPDNMACRASVGSSP